MTYSHKSVGNHIMTPATIATTTARTKNVSNGGSGGGDYKNRTLSPTTPPPICAHSNSIASSTNHSHHVLSTSPPGFMSSGASVSSNCSSSSNTSSLGSNGNGSGGGFYATRCRIRNNGQHQPQRQSPQQLFNAGAGSYNTNKYNYQQRQSSGGILISGSAQKHPRDVSKSPSSQTRRQSPAVILGSGASIICSSGGGSGRKYRAKLTTTNQNPLTNAASGGKISPTHPLIPTALTHFAGSKCFDAPSPTALPKPPQHWTLIEAKIGEKVNSCAGPGLHSVTNARKPTMHAVDAHTYGGHVVKTSKRNLLDDFDTHNLKLLLNVHS